MRIFVTTRPLDHAQDHNPKTGVTQDGAGNTDLGQQHRQNHAHKPSKPATDRSKAPLMISKVIPAAPIPLKDDCSNTLRMFGTCRKFEFAAPRMITAISNSHWIVYWPKIYGQFLAEKVFCGSSELDWKQFLCCSSLTCFARSAQP